VVGSLTPDLGYCFGELNVDKFSHGLLGSVLFCVPVGALLLGLLFRVILPALGRLTNHYKRMLPPVFSVSLGPPLVILLSLLIGAWTHLLWDSLTHKSGWFVEHLPFLKSLLLSVAGHSVRICHLLSYASTFVGVVLL
jgi:hypothetical protein